MKLSSLQKERSQRKRDTLRIIHCHGGQGKECRQFALPNGSSAVPELEAAYCTLLGYREVVCDDVIFHWVGGLV